jgi:phage/plasmid-like protein (TIGR03299 family)
MAHNLNRVNGKWSFAAKGEKAWHGLGQYVEKAMTSEEAITLGGLDYRVEKRKLFTVDDNGRYLEVPDYYSNVRVDTNDSLGVVKSRYSIVQNRDAFSFFDSIIDSGEAIFETAGALGKGERIFITAKLPEDMVVHGEAVEKYILLTNTHDGSSSIIAGFTPIRVVCNNTLQASLGSLTNKISIAHTSSAESKLREASRLMGIASKYMNELNSIFDSMSTRKVSEAEIDRFLKDVFAVKKKDDEDNIDENAAMSSRMTNILRDVKDFALGHPTQTTEAAYRTVWGLYNSVSGYFTHVKNYKSEEHRMHDLVYNGASEKINKAFQLANQMI